MAAILTQGRRFNLSNVPTNKNSSVLYVKLTDSSLKAIEEYQQAKNLKRKASISFCETIGVVNIPLKDADSPRTFDFSIQPSQNDDCFQCIKHSKANGVCNLESLGVLSQKLTIQAGDDVYENTLKKMTIVEQQSKKPRTKEIKSSGPNNGSRLRKILRNVARNSQNPSSGRSSRPQAVSSSSQRKQATASINAQPRVTPASRAALSTSPNGRISPFATTSKEKNGAIPVPTVTTPAMTLALRDRIIHLLAIKNYKKPEMLLKLKMDGLSDKDKDLFVPTLEQVAQVNSRDNSYSLQRHLYTSDVKHDWALYNDNDRQQLNKKLSWLSLNPPLNPRTISPCPSNGSQGSPPRVKKFDLVDMAPKRLSDIQDGTTASVPGSRSSFKRRGDAGDATGPPPPKKVRVAHNAKRDASRPGSLALPVQDGFPSQVFSLQTGSATSGVSPSSDMAEDLADASCDAEDDDFKRGFTTIKSYEERCRYKMEFNKGHKEHQEVYNQISNKVATIVELQAQIMQEAEGTLRYDALRNEIYEEYFRLKNDSDYVKDRNRYEYLVKKLAHIKQLVYAYDHDHQVAK